MAVRYLLFIQNIPLLLIGSNPVAYIIVQFRIRRGVEQSVKDLFVQG